MIYCNNQQINNCLTIKEKTTTEISKHIIVITVSLFSWLGFITKLRATAVQYNNEPSKSSRPQAFTTDFVKLMST